jgi:hypothetical protein
MVPTLAVLERVVDGTIRGDGKNFHVCIIAALGGNSTVLCQRVSSLELESWLPSYNASRLTRPDRTDESKIIGKSNGTRESTDEFVKRVS